MTLVEICLDDASGPAAAQRGGAGRIELCAALPLGGLTPSLGAVEQALATCDLPVQVLIRPRHGGFGYDLDEAATILADVSAMATLAQDRPGRLGITTGALADDGQPDIALVAAILEEARGLPVCFHRAFDACPHPLRALDALAACGIGSVLTGGGPGRARDQLDALRALTEAAGDRLAIVAAGGIRAQDVRAVAGTGVAAVHLRAPGAATERGAVRTAYDLPREVTDAGLVADVVTALRG